MHGHTDAPLLSGQPVSVRDFLVRAALWNLALFAAIRLAWIDRYVIDALVEFQKSIVFWYGTTPRPGIVVTSSCSGADVMALCAGVTLSFPATWRRRLVGAGVGLVFILALNVLRIVSLYAVASTPSTLKLLHIYVWPAILTIAVVLYLLAFIHRSARRTDVISTTRWTRFVAVALGALVVYAAAVPWIFTSSALHRAGVWTASAGALILTGLGATAWATDNLIITNRGAFRVTQECLFTPMIPVYLAAVFAMPLSRGRRLTWLVLALPIFMTLGVARVLVLALPASMVDLPVFLAHGFYQFVAGAVAIVAGAHLALGRHSGLRASQRTLAGLAVALGTGLVAVRLWEPALVQAAIWLQTLVSSTITALTTGSDRQGALALLPAFQVGLVTGLWYVLTGGRGFRRLGIGLAVLFCTQLAFLAVLGTASAWLDVAPHALVVRAWALGVPLALAVVWVAQAGTVLGDRAYEKFWHEVGEEFPDLAGAASTTYYFENEKRLITAALPSLAGCTLLKTDLWDEAKNTRIMQWAADQGSRVYGIDLSEPVVRAARAEFRGRRVRPAISDVRRLPFADGSFDAIYSMGTVEHFAETEMAVGELARALKPGGRLILGVPNRHDPFLRPLMVAILNGLGAYGYGYEKSYSRRDLKRMLLAAGLEVRMESGLLFMPGWLRMLDLWCHTRKLRLARATGAVVRVFAWLDNRVPALRRHGYLLATVGVKPPVAGHLPESPGYDPHHALDTPVWQLPVIEPPSGAAPATGTEYVIDVRGCDGSALQSLPRLQRLFSEVLADLAMRRLAPPVWHVFAGHGGVTGMVLLAESHLTIHTFPEAKMAAINLYCCRSSAEWDWSGRLRSLLGATEVTVRILQRG